MRSSRRIEGASWDVWHRTPQGAPACRPGKAATMAAGDLLVSETVQGHGAGPATPPTRFDFLQCMALQVGMSPLEHVRF